MPKSVLIYIFSLCFFVSGCAVVQHADEIQTLQELSKSQKEMETYVKERTRQYRSLKKDIVNGKIEKGLSMEFIIKKYGEPTFSEKTDTDTEEFTYRDPRDYFSDESVYLYFDGNGQLAEWKK